MPGVGEDPLGARYKEIIGIASTAIGLGRVLRRVVPTPCWKLASCLIIYAVTLPSQCSIYYRTISDSLHGMKGDGAIAATKFPEFVRRACEFRVECFDANFILRFPVAVK